MDESIQAYYADGSAVSVGDIVEFDRESALDSYSGYVREMDDLVGYKLRVISVGSSHDYHGSNVAVIKLEGVCDPDGSVRATLAEWSYSSDMFVQALDFDGFDASDIEAFIEEV